MAEANSISTPTHMTTILDASEEKSLTARDFFIHPQDYVNDIWI
jgi:hypothetical protein